ncbi:MAG: prepilin-type N-terminal cleavage/methylation domain-containing protein [Phycisphaerales bacterium]|nr:prepilin-type N-terminal cleavage/methylation domain-containing protein [Phycisphaerales bacterium]
MRRAFTLIELLVVIAIIALLIGIIIPALGGARENARRVKCMVNLSSVGKAVQQYMDSRSKGVLPIAVGLLETPDRKLLAYELREFLDSPVPTKGTDGRYDVADPWKCPSDVKSDDAASNFEPSYRATGSSYEYWPGSIMLVTEFIALDLARPEFSLTKMYQTRKWPIVSDYNQLHTGRAPGLDRRNALYLDGGMRVDWSIAKPELPEIQSLFSELFREPKRSK